MQREPQVLVFLLGGSRWVAGQRVEAILRVLRMAKMVLDVAIVLRGDRGLEPMIFNGCLAMLVAIVLRGDRELELRLNELLK